MGIPSYFSYIIKNYANIIKSLYSLKSKNTKFHRMYMDCNSIIYDAFHTLSVEPISELDKDSTHYSTNQDRFNNKLVDTVILNIEKYIKLIQPSETIYIAFDGVAPFAKMDQQRNRRYKTWYLSNISFDSTVSSTKPLYNTSMITPGTDFMILLSQRVTRHFTHMEHKYGVNTLIVSAADEPGEGEHKMFDHMRQNTSAEQNVAVYGLDSDLIMLSIFHCKLFRNIFIFREAPEFMKSSIPITPETPDEPYFMDIGLLSNAILDEMQCGVSDKQRIYDYVFLCFFLGNDFLPHFPSLNIRTHGIQTLLDTYRKYIGNYNDRFFISRDTGKIVWKWVSLFIGELAKFEHQLLLEEYVARDKFENRKWAYSNPKEKEQTFQSIPIIYRADEKYIYPQEKFWEERYYKSLFNESKEEVFTNSLCLNYIEGLEWVFKYYTVGCPDWRWKYNYHYPPLLSDLLKYIPHFDMDFIKNNASRPFSTNVQLAYVLPKIHLDLLPKKNKQYLCDNYKHVYPEKIEFQWAFCRYFWEAHAVLPEISIATLDKWGTVLL